MCSSDLPSEGQQPSEQDEEDKCEVKQENRIGQEECCSRPCRHKARPSLFFRLLLRIDFDDTVASVAERLDLEQAPAWLKSAGDCGAVDHEREIALPGRFELSADEARVVAARESGHDVQLIPTRVEEFDGDRRMRPRRSVFQCAEQRLIEGNVPITEYPRFLGKRGLVGDAGRQDCAPEQGGRR